MKQLCENCQAKYEFKIPLRICPWCGQKKLIPVIKLLGEEITYHE